MLIAHGPNPRRARFCERNHRHMDMEVDALEPESATSDGGAKSLSPGCNADYVDTTQSSSAYLHPADETVNGCAAEGTNPSSRPTTVDLEPRDDSELRERFREIKNFIEACTAPRLVFTKWRFLDEEHTQLRIRIQSVRRDDRRG
jgi:hypothetical protein